MKTNSKIFALLTVCTVGLFLSSAVFAYTSSQIVVNAGSNLYLTSGQTTTLQGSGYDSYGSPVNFYWSCNGGTLSNYNVAQPVYTSPYSSGQNAYTCTLTVTNTSGVSNSATTTIYVNYNGNNNNNGSFYAQTNAVTYISNYQATLNGYFAGATYNSYVWFQWGTSTNYTNTSNQQIISYSGSFSQNIANLAANTTYHYRAVAQNNGTIVYGSDMTFYVNSNGSGTSYANGTGTLSVSKNVIDVSSGNLNWQTSINANPSDILTFAITLQPNGQDIHNVFIRDILPAGLIYRGNLMLNAVYYPGDITSGINIGTVYTSQPDVISYQVQVSPNIGYGSNTLTNNVSVSSTESGSQTASASVFINNTVVYGASTGPTYVSTGQTNNFLTDSFFLPLFLITLMSYLYFTGKVYTFADWLGAKIN